MRIRTGREHGLMPTSKAAKAEKEIRRSGPLRKLRVYLKALGPGLITGASDDVPSGIGTYSQTGAFLRLGSLSSTISIFSLGIQRLSHLPRFFDEEVNKLSDIVEWVKLQK